MKLHEFTSNANTTKMLRIEESISNTITEVNSSISQSESNMDHDIIRTNSKKLKSERFIENSNIENTSGIQSETQCTTTSSNCSNNLQTKNSNMDICNGKKKSQIA